MEDIQQDVSHGTTDIKAEGKETKDPFASPMPVVNKNVKRDQHFQSSSLKDNQKSLTSEDVVAQDDNTKSAAVKAEVAKKIPYNEPNWSGVANKSYSLEVLKDGCIVDIWNLNDKAYYTFGRLPTCNFVLEHPSVSRYHAVLQFRPCVDNDSDKVGFYLYDLGSTHGSQVNKSPIEPRRYYRLRVGYMMKFGGSSRVYILQGPNDDQEEEIYADDIRKDVKQVLNADEIQQLQQQQKKAQRVKEDKEKGSKDEITWGIDYALEEEQADIDIIEKARGTHDDNDDSYFVKDPKKALRHFFETAGAQLEYEVCESGTPRNRTFQARIKLPVETSEGNCIYGEGTAEKKKDAVVACALDGCRILDAYGMLRSSAAIKRKRKNWEENDYYDSDEDNFLDRTGDVENKRLARMKRAGKISEDAETFQSLSLKLKEIQDEMARLRNKLNKAKGQEQNAEIDSLDAYMNSVSNTLDARAITSIRLHLSDLRKKEEKLIKLVEIARPAELPDYLQLKKAVDSNDLVKSSNILSSNQGDMSSSTDLKSQDIEKSSRKSTSIVQNVRLKTKGVQFLGAHQSKMTEPKIKDDDDIMEYDSESDSEETKKTDTSLKAMETESNTGYLSEKLPSNVPTSKVQVATSNQNFDDESNSEDMKVMKANTVHDDECIDWLPPEDQFGDGKTNLNTKFGY